jgi:o-succinylbenzoate synthase
MVADVRLVGADLFRYRLPLVAPLRLAFGTLTHREGVLLRLTTADGTEGWGEAAPLPGFSRETLGEAIAALQHWCQAGEHGRALADLPSSAQFAVESAELDLRAQQLGMTMAQVLDSNASREIVLNGLVVGSGNESVAAAKHLAEAGYPTVKLKVGQRTVEEDAETVKAVRAVLPESVRLRLDANRAWAYAEALRFAQGIEGVALNYIEEPLANPERLADFAVATGLQVALDESLIGLEPDDLERHCYASALVLKPSVGGGLRWAYRMAERAHALRLTPVVSNAFESGVGLRAHVALAAAIAPSPAGLDTYCRLAADVYAERLPLAGPTVHVEAVLMLRTPDLSTLEPIS